MITSNYWRVQASSSQTGNAAGVQLNLSCEDFRKLIPSDYVQGFLEVPENWEGSSPRTVRVFYYGKLPRGSTNKKAILHFNGGPNEASHISFQIVSALPQANDLPILFMDQRGTGCSDAYPSGNDPETVKRLSHYVSRSIVLDAEALRRKLFGETSKWIVFGQSYGAFIVHRYIQVAPNGLDAAFAHAFAIPTDFSEFLRFQFQSEKRVSDQFFAQYPEDQKKLIQIRPLFSPTTCFDNGEARVCGPALLDGLAYFLGAQTQWQTLHAVIGKLLNTDDTLNLGLYKTLFDTAFSVIYLAAPMPNTVIGMVDFGASDEAANRALSEIRASGQDPDSWPLFDARFKMAAISLKPTPAGLSQVSRDQITSIDVRASLQKNPKLEFYLYSGALDSFVPPSSFGNEVSALGNRIHYFEFPNSGHDGFFAEQRIWDDLVQQEKL